MPARKGSLGAKWRRIGHYFGYPACCIADFVTRALRLRAPSYFQALAAGNTGFVPCPGCASAVVSGRFKLGELVRNRVCSAPFPQTDTATSVELARFLAVDSSGAGVTVPDVTAAAAPPASDTWTLIRMTWPQGSISRWVVPTSKLDDELSGVQHFMGPDMSLSSAELTPDQGRAIGPLANRLDWLDRLMCDLSVAEDVRRTASSEYEKLQDELDTVLDALGLTVRPSGPNLGTSMLR